ncbi:hypothetical protein H5410_049748 [Solanum commersonii]|uniref:Uncharacterized protein n=1 Tax=Solanum commersonii TaxID=4109 RepID=A0A9J5WTH1_SOLCO|nr:hypothetical protein H5410_049748 [Solanum commersonii]
MNSRQNESTFKVSQIRWKSSIITFNILQQFNTYKQLPRLAKGSYVLEKLGFTNFRRKKLNRIKPYAFNKCRNLNKNGREN